jgi:hypothetical protein
MVAAIIIGAFTTVLASLVAKAYHADWFFAAIQSEPYPYHCAYRGRVSRL